jgi:hypothetical protein
VGVPDDPDDESPYRKRSTKTSFRHCSQVFGVRFLSSDNSSGAQCPDRENIIHGEETGKSYVWTFPD